MSSQLFHEYFSNKQVIDPLDGGRTRKLWIDSCRVHNNTPELLESLQICQTEIRRFHPNCTSLVQPLDQMLLRSFKSEWRKRWDKKRNELVKERQFTNSRRVANPGKCFYLNLVNEIVDELNSRTIGNCSIAQQSMIKCGLIPNLSGNWEISQLTDKLQDIVQNILSYFNGQDPTTQ